MPMENLTFAITTTIRLLCWENNTSCLESTTLILQAKEATKKFLKVDKDLEQAIKMICNHLTKPKTLAIPKGLAIEIKQTFQHLQTILRTNLHLEHHHKVTSWKDSHTAYSSTQRHCKEKHYTNVMKNISTKLQKRRRKQANTLCMSTRLQLLFMRPTTKS